MANATVGIHFAVPEIIALYVHPTLQLKGEWLADRKKCSPAHHSGLGTEKTLFRVKSPWRTLIPDRFGYDSSFKAVFHITFQYRVRMRHIQIYVWNLMVNSVITLKEKTQSNIWSGRGQGDKKKNTHTISKQLWTSPSVNNFSRFKSKTELLSKSKMTYMMQLRGSKTL